jgi:hypothetical protein
MKKAIAFVIALAGSTAAAVFAAVLWEQAKAPAAELQPVWTEFKWPFLVDEWGVGRAFVCRPTACGSEVKIYLRPKIGFCKCATGVDDDEELERVSDLGLMGDKTVAVGTGRPIEVAWMNGRSRRYNAAGLTEDQLLSIAFNDSCDVMVAVATLGRSNRDAIERAVIAFLNSERIIAWTKWLMS